MYCPKCGTQNQDNNFKCTRCGEILHASVPATNVVVKSDDTLAALIPYKNGPALAAYYLGVFSLIPFLGCPLGIAALILGLRGLRKAKDHPETRGKAHAWVGIIAGGFFGFLYLLLIVFLVYAALKG